MGATYISINSISNPGKSDNKKDPKSLLTKETGNAFRETSSRLGKMKRTLLPSGIKPLENIKKQFKGSLGSIHKDCLKSVIPKETFEERVLPAFNSLIESLKNSDSKDFASVFDFVSKTINNYPTPHNMLLVEKFQEFLKGNIEGYKEKYEDMYGFFTYNLNGKEIRSIVDLLSQKHEGLSEKAKVVHISDFKDSVARMIEGQSITYIIHKDEGHVSSVHVRKIKGGELTTVKFFFLDAAGQYNVGGPKFGKSPQSSVIGLAFRDEHSKYLLFDSGDNIDDYGLKRQAHDQLSCSVFAIRDAVTIAKNPDCIDELERVSKKSEDDDGNLEMFKFDIKDAVKNPLFKYSQYVTTHGVEEKLKGKSLRHLQPIKNSMKKQNRLVQDRLIKYKMLLMKKIFESPD